MLLLLRPVLLRSVIAVLMFPRDAAIRNRSKNSGVEDVQSALNQMMKDKVIETLPRRALPFAIDFVFIPFYGKEENDGDTIKSNAWQGATRFFVYASIYMILMNKRYTLAVK